MSSLVVDTSSHKDNESNSDSIVIDVDNKDPRLDELDIETYKRIEPYIKRGFSIGQCLRTSEIIYDTDVASPAIDIPYAKKNDTDTTPTTAIIHMPKLNTHSIGNKRLDRNDRNDREEDEPWVMPRLQNNNYDDDDDEVFKLDKTGGFESDDSVTGSYEEYFEL